MQSSTTQFVTPLLVFVLLAVALSHPSTSYSLLTSAMEAVNAHPLAASLLFAAGLVLVAGPPVLFAAALAAAALALADPSARLAGWGFLRSAMQRGDAVIPAPLRPLGAAALQRALNPPPPARPPPPAPPHTTRAPPPAPPSSLQQPAVGAAEDRQLAALSPAGRPARVSGLAAARERVRAEVARARSDAGNALVRQSGGGGSASAVRGGGADDEAMASATTTRMVVSAAPLPRAGEMAALERRRLEVTRLLAAARNDEQLKP